MNHDDVAAQPASPNTQEYQQRATAAEAKVAELEAQLGSANGALSESQEALSGLRRKYEVDLELVQAGAVDLEAGRVLVAAAMAQMPKADPRRAIAELKRTKPFLFRASGNPKSSMYPGGQQIAQGLVLAAEHARSSGDRRALLSYLRAKRSQ